MYLEENKKVLFIAEMKLGLGHDIRQKCNVSPENMILLQNDELARIQPFGELMRDIILTVYQEKVEEIFVIITKEDSASSQDTIGERKIPQKNTELLDYLFTHCYLEIPDRTIKEWLEGSAICIEDRHNVVDVIRHHPLMPPSVKVTELSIDEKTKKQLQIDVV